MSTGPGEASASVTVRRTIPISRERVFDAWLDPARLALFMRPRGDGHAEVEVDPSTGGRFRIVMHHAASGAEGVVHTGEYLLIDRPRRLVFSWRSRNTGDRDTTVTVDFLERGSGTEVVLTHEQLPPTQLESHRNGWRTILSLLEEAVG